MAKAAKLAGTVKAKSNASKIIIPQGEKAFAKTKGVSAYIAFGMLGENFVAEYYVNLGSGINATGSMPLTTNSQAYALRALALAAAALRLLDQINALIQGVTLSAAQQKGVDALQAWAKAIIEEGKCAQIATPAAGQLLQGTTYLDVCGGIGGGGEGFKQYGAQCGGLIERDAEARKTYQANNPGTYPVHDDLCTAKASMFGEITFLIAGFPCQSVSIAGDRQGFKASKKSGLFFEVVRLAKEFKTPPKVIVLENVLGILSHDDGDTHEIVIRTMTGLGYAGTVKVCNSADYGLAGQRERVIYVFIHDSVLPNRTTPFDFPLGTDSSKVIADILEEAPTIKHCERAMKRTKPNPIEKSRHIEVIGVVGDKSGAISDKPSQGYRVAHPNGKGFTLCANSGGAGQKTGLYLIGGKLRTLTPRECARVQGFPESFIPHKKHAIAKRQFGNSMAVPVVAAIAKQLAHTIRF